MSNFNPFIPANNSSSLITLLRNVPSVSPEDTLLRFVELIGYGPHSVLPVVADHVLLGYVYQADVLFLLGFDDEQARIVASYNPVSSIMRSASPVLLAEQTRYDAEKAFASNAIDLIGVVDAEGYYMGAVTARDLLCGYHVPVRLPTVSGMATPFGVYLSDGTIQAGASNLALAAGGAAIGLFISIAMIIVHLALLLGTRYLHQDLTMYTLDYSAPGGDLKHGLVGVGVHITTTLLFLIMIRFSSIAGYHAAEHQTVHAIERGEPLVADVVARMPRPHPRCGTNLMAAAILFVNLASVFRAFDIDQETAPILAVVVTLFTWRRFGTWLQAWLTTRPANLRELNSGIFAATSLAEKYRFAPPHRGRFARRIWCSGLLQSIAGMLPTVTLLAYIFSDWIR